MSLRGKKNGVVGIFKYLDDTCDAMDQINKRSDCEGYEVLAPASYHELIERAEHKYGDSQVRWFTMIGAFSGVSAGFAMPLWMDNDWPIVVGGKLAGLYSLPAYFIFGFELMVLLGAIATIIGMLVMGRLPNPRETFVDPRITDDHFAIYIPKATLESQSVEVLKKNGACDVKLVSM